MYNVRNQLLFGFKLVLDVHIGEDITVKTLTQCDVAATDQFVMIVQGIITVSVIWICVYQTVIRLRVPADSDTARVKFTRILTLNQCGGSWMKSAAIRCSCIFSKSPLGCTVDIR